MHIKRYSTNFLLFSLLLLSCRASCQIDVYREELLAKRLRHTPCIVAFDDDSCRTKVQLRHMLTQKGRSYIPEEGNEMRSTDLSVIGGMRGRKVSSVGYAAYLNASRKGNQWCNALNMLEGNPYQLADSSIGKYKMECYAFGGSSAMELLPNMLLGGSFGYYAGTAFRTIDPRPNNRFYRLRCSVGLQYVNDRWTTGVAAAVGRRAETVSIAVFKPNSKALFIRKLGLAFIDYKRSCSADHESIRYDGGAYELSANASSLTSVGRFTVEASLANSIQEHQQSDQVIPYEYRLTNSQVRLHYETTGWGVNHVLQAKWRKLNGKGTENTYVRQAANTSSTLYNEIKVSSSNKYDYVTTEAMLGYSAISGCEDAERYRRLDIQGGLFDWSTKYRYPQQKAFNKGVYLGASICERLHIAHFWIEPLLAAGLRCVSRSSYPDYTAYGDKNYEGYDTEDPKWKELQPTVAKIQKAFSGTMQLLSTNRQTLQLAVALSYPINGYRLVLTPTYEIERIAGLATNRVLSISALMQL